MATRNAHAAFGTGEKLMALAVLALLSVWSGRASEDVQLSELDGLAIQVDRSPCVSFQAEDVAMLTSGTGELLGLVTVRSGAAPGAPLRRSGVTLMRLDIRLLPHPRRLPPLGHTGAQAPPLEPENGIFFARPAPMAPVARARPDPGRRRSEREAHASRQLQGTDHQGDGDAEATGPGGGAIGAAGLLDASSDAGAAAAVSAGVSDVAGRTGNDTHPVANIMVSLSRRVPDACPSRVPALRAAAAVDCSDLGAAGEETQAHAEGGSAGGSYAVAVRRASMLVEVPTSLFRCASDDTEQTSRSFFVQLRVDLSRQKECGADDSEPVYAGEAANEISPGCSYLIVTGECKPDSCPPPPPPPAPEQVQLQLLSQHHQQTLQAADPLEPGQQQQAAEARQLLSIAAAVASDTAAAVEAEASAGIAADATAVEPHRHRAVSDLAQEVVPADGDAIGVGSGVEGVGGSDGAGQEGAGAARRKPGEGSAGLLAVVLHGHGPALDEVTPAAAVTTGGAATRLEAGTEAAGATKDAAAPRELRARLGVTNPGAAALLASKLQAGGSSSSSRTGDGGSLPSVVGSGHGGDKAWAHPAADARRLQQHAPNCIGAECPPATRRRWLLYAVGGVIGSTALAAVIAAFLMRSRTRAAAAVAAAAAAAAEALASMAAADAVAKMAAAAAPASVEAAMVDPAAATLPALQIPAAVMEMDGKAASPRPTSPTTFDRSGSIAGASPAIVGSCTAASGDLYRPSWDGRMSSSGSGAVGYAQLVLGRSGSYSSTTACAGALPPLPYDRSGSSNSATAAAFPAPYDRSGSSNSTTAAAAAATPYNRTGSSTSTNGVGAMPIVVISRGGGGDTVTATSSPTPASYVPHSMHASFSSSTADIYSPRRSRWLPPQGTAAAAAAGAVAGAGAVAPRGSPSHFMSQSFTHGHAAPPQHIAAAGVLNTRSQLPPSSPAYAPGTDTYAHTPSGSARVRQQQYVGGGGGDAVAGAAGVSDSGAAAPSPRSNIAVGIGIDAGGGSAAATGPPLRTSSTGRLATIFSRSDESLPVLPAELVAAMRHQVYEQQDVYEQQQQQQQQEQQAQQQGLVAPLGLQPLGKLRDGSEPHSGSTGPGQEPPAAPRQASSSAAVSPFWAVGGAGSGITPRMETRGRNGSGSAPVEPYVLADEHRQQHHDVLGSAASTCSRYSVSAVQSRQHTEPGGATSEPGSAPEAAPAPGSAVSWVAGENLKQPRKLPAAAPLSPNFQQYGAPGAGAGSRTHLTATASARASPLRPPGSFARGSMHTTRPSVPASPAQQPQAHRPPESLLAQLQPLGSPVTPPSVAARDAKQRLLHQQQRQVEPGAKRVVGALLGVFDGATVTKITGQDAAHAPTRGAAPESKVIVGNQLHASKLDCEEVDSKAAFAAAATAAATTAALGMRGALSPLHRHEVLDEALLPASGPATAQHENLHLGSDDEDDGAGMGGDCMGEDGDEGFVSAALYAGQPLSANGSQSGGVPGLTLRASSISTDLAAAAAVAAALRQQSQPPVAWPGPGRAAGATEEGAASSASVAMGQARWSQSTVPGGAPLASHGSISIGGGVAISLQPTMQQDRHGRMAERQLQPQRPQHSSAHGEYGMPHGAATHGKSFHRLMGGGVVGSSPTTLDGGVDPQQPGTRLASFTHTTGGAAAAAVAVAVVASQMGVVTTTAVATTASASSTPPVYTRTSAAGSGPGAGGWRGWGGVGSGTPPLQPRSGAQSAAATAPTSPYTLIGVTAAYVPGVTCTLPAPSSDGSPARDVC